MFALLASALSEEGLRKTRAIIKLEGILGELTGRPDFRDPENYALAIFGDPAGKAPWAWRFEGHHVSLTFTIAPGLGIAVTPAFFGANPAEVPAGHEHAGLRVLAVKQDLALALLHDLSSAQQQTAILQPQSFRDFLTGPGREDSLRQPQGLALAAMTPAQRDQTLALIEAYVRNMRADLAEQELRALHEAGPEKLHFAWAGADRARHLPLLPAARADLAGRVRQHRAQPHPHGVAQPARQLRRGPAAPASRDGARLSRASQGVIPGSRRATDRSIGLAARVAARSQCSRRQSLRPRSAAAAPAGRSWAVPGP